MQVFSPFFPVVRPSILSLSELILRFSILANLMSRIEIFHKFGLYFRFFPTVDPLLFFALWFFWLKSPLFRDRTSEKFKYFKENIKSCIRKIQNIFLILVSGIKDGTVKIFGNETRILSTQFILTMLTQNLTFATWSHHYDLTQFFNDFSTRITVYIQL